MQLPGQVQRQLSGVAKSANSVLSSSRAIGSVNRNQVKSWDDLTVQLGNVERKYDAVFRAGIHLTQMGSAMVSMATGIAGVLYKAADAWGTFEFTMNRAAGAMDLFDTTSALYGKLKTAIYDAAREARLFPAEDIAKATYYWQSTTGETIKTEQQLDRVLRNVTTAMQAAALTQSSYEQVIKGAYSVMKQYGMTLDDIPLIMQSLFVETQRTALELPDLIQSFKFVGPLANSLGISFETISKTLGLLGDLGQRGSQAGRGLGMMLTQLVRPAPKGIKAMEELFKKTLKVKDGYNKLVFPKGKFIGLEKFVTLLAKATSKLTQQQRLNYITSIVGTQNAARVIIPLIDAQIRAMKKGGDIFADPKYSLAGAAKNFAKAFELLKTSWKGVVGLLKETVEPIILEVGRHIAEALNPFLEKAADFLQRIREWIQANPKIVDMAVRIAAITAAALAAGGALFLLGGAILFLIGNLGVFIEGIGRVMAPFAALALAIVGIGYVIANNVGGIRTALGDLGRAIGELVKAVVGDGKALLDGWDDVWAFFRDVVTDVATKLADGIRWLAGAVRDLASNETFLTWARAVIDIFIKYRGVITTLAALSAGMWAAGIAVRFMWSGFMLISGLGMAIKAIKALALGLVAVRAALVAGGLLQGMAAFLALLTGISLTPIVLIIGAIAAAIALLALAWVNNWGGIRDIVGTVVGAITGWISGFITFVTGTLVPTISGAVSSIIGFFANLPANISAAFTTVIEAIGGFIAMVVENVTGFIANLGGMFLGFLTNLWNNWAYYLGYILGFVLGWLVRIPFEVGKFIIDIGGKFLGWLSALPGQFANWFGRVWSDLVTWFGKVIPNIAGWLGQIVGSFITWIGSLPGRFAGWLGQVWTNVSTWFGTFITNVGKWASDAVGGILKWFTELPGKIMGALVDLPTNLFNFIIGLPGRLWNALLEVGRAIIEGIWNGIKSLWEWLMKSVGDFFGGIVQGVKDAFGIKSPSKVMAEIGSQLVAGLAVGIQTNDAAHRALTGYTDALVASAGATTLRIGGLAAALTGETTTFESSAERVIRVQIDLTSSDSSVDQYSLEQLKAAITGSDLVTAIETMASKD